jgi:DNA-binding response OmpR family regulator
MSKILIVEDDREILDLLFRKISNAGYEVLIAQDGEEGLKLLRKEIPDLVLLDMALPSIDGLEFLKRKQVVPETKEIPVIIISNSGAASEISQARHLGAQEWIIKTKFNLQETIDKIDKIIQESS